VVGSGWVHLVFTADGAAWHAYINGTAVPSGAIAGGLASSADPLVLGRDGVAAQAWFDGWLADVAVYPYSLNADQVSRHYALREVSAAGAAPLAYAIEANDSGAVRTGTLTVAGVRVPVSQAAAAGVSIVGGVVPSPNTAGWNHTAVTVSFTCAGAGAVTCQPPMEVSQDGEQDVQGTASNDLGATANATVHVKIDRTAPVVVITSPSLGELVVAGPVTVRGSVIDGLSGLLGVSCNGTAATVDDTGFTCQVVVPAGTTTVEVLATDVASNVRRATIDVATVEEAVTTPPLGLRVSPAKASLVMGASRGFTVKDTFGRVLPGITWSVDAEGVASLEPTGGEVTVTGVTAGVVHVTAAWQGLTAQAELTVLAVVGTTSEVRTLWSTPPVAGSVQRIVQGATRADGTHRIYTYESPGEPHSHDMIRAFEQDGREAWTAAAGGAVLQVSGDPSGGVVALVHDWEAFTNRLRIFGPHGGEVSGSEGVGPFAIHPNGPLYYVNQANTLVGLDIGLGGGPGATLSGTPGYPTVLLDGSVVVPSVVDPEQLQLTFVRSTGAVETQVVTVPNGGLWSPYRAIPNGQGGLLVQLIRRLVWPGGDYWRWDAVVVGVDASGALTGSTGLGADWGEIVVGENGTIVATSQVEYSTEPSWGGGAKRHVGMLMPLQANGNPGGLASFYGPSGSCGWIWDNIGQQWFYNGDCGQPVLSITSVAARGSELIVTLNDGQVLAPGPLGQMRLSNLVPATDGTYLGGGAGGASAGELVNVAVTSEEPVSPLGAEWPEGAGSRQSAYSASPLSALRVIADVGDNESRALAFAALKDALVQDPAGSIAASKLSMTKDGYVQVNTTIGDFKRSGTIARNLGDLMNRLALDTRVLEFGFTNDDLGHWGGARSVPPGLPAGSTPCSAYRPCVRMNLENLKSSNREFTIDTSIGAIGQRSLRFEGQDQNPAWQVRDFISGSGETLHLPVAMWHEFGHEWGAIHGRRIDTSETDKEAIDWENVMRLARYRSCGQYNARRIRHDARTSETPLGLPACVAK
jgi:hypothetical protein